MVQGFLVIRIVTDIPIAKLLSLIGGQSIQHLDQRQRGLGMGSAKGSQARLHALASQSRPYRGDHDHVQGRRAVIVQGMLQHVKRVEDRGLNQTFMSKSKAKDGPMNGSISR